MSDPLCRVIVVRKKEQMSRYRTLDILSLSEVEREVDIMIEIIGDRTPDNDEIKQVSELISLAKSLGTKRNW
jgi:hypothetical protein